MPYKDLEKRKQYHKNYNKKYIRKPVSDKKVGRFKEILQFKDDIIDMYCNKNIACKNISNKYKVDFSVIERLLKSENIKIKTNSFYRTKKKVEKYSGEDEIGPFFWQRITSSAKRRKITFKVTKKYLIKLLHNQKYKCALSNIDIKIPFTRNSLGNASLDRIDSSKGYIEGNVQWVDADINKIKLDNTINEFYDICKNVFTFNKLKRFINKPTIKIFNIPSDFIHNCKNSAKARKLSYNIKKEYLIDIFEKQGGICNISGKAITIPKTNTSFLKFQHNASIDRIDSNIGYEINNIQWLDKKINRMKWTLSNSEFINLCSLVYHHLKDKYDYQQTFS